jgi:hypothetical protein
MTAFAQINVSHDGMGDTYRRVRGFDGAHVAERAMRLLADAEPEPEREREPESDSELVAIYDIKIQDEFANTLDYKLTPVLLSKCFDTKASNSCTSLLPYSSASCSASSSSCISANSSASSFEQQLHKADAPFVESFHMPLSVDSASQSDFSALRVDYKPKGKMITVNVSMMW